MGRPKAKNPRRHQVLIRVTSQQQQLLEAAAALHRCTVSAYVHSLVDQNLSAIDKDPLVQRQLRLFEEFQARQKGKVTSLMNASGGRRRGPASREEQGPRSS